MLTLAIDTAARFCSACAWDGKRVLGVEERDIGRGHAEQLMEVVAGALAGAGRAFSDIGRIAVAVGPGSFTGIRVGVAAARGFGLALGAPVVGITTLEALAEDARGVAAGALAVAVHGGRGQVFLQSFAADGAPVGEPVAVPLEEAASLVAPSIGCIAGNAATDIAAALGRPVQAVLDRPTGSITTIARLAERSGRRPVPLYLRGADARPQSGFALPRTGSGA
ncbi:tRNA (adenosine(37)-N6)-threonylcarbamoyltransferase complex dimerization subunit type 1 TsaB [Oricola thermophila]|uniref:N(6)-L-threonylcarbamoyladenine synthase n=1 Tax=Oricola thermophila TaxID=2742145 RepID=A0A6N1VK19_9HYPH|nr:tRNA (adenosine(37)-N6)-threonylcarbamoyltransferase complex dimerization subunit type 1 TsaB [Oricola thermophila]QKV19549.1 tRNA (adenosine(37)-N6)-threonylcarbamoyltransferase complex dimerization subunit type 1 TsaB [Oricola thermophila]